MKKSLSLDDVGALAKQNRAEAKERLLSKLRHGGGTIGDLASVVNASAKQVRALLDEIASEGKLNLHDHGGVWAIDRQPTPGHTRTDIQDYVSSKDGWLRFGFTSDNHLCSKYSRLDVLNDLYDKFAEAKVDRVLNAGNWIDGEARFNKHDLLVHGVDAQLDYLAEHYPQRAGITTYAVAGDDHEGWYAQSAGMDIGRMAQTKMREKGREDWVDMGYMESFIRLVHKQSGNGCMLHLMHPGGGTSYAISYTMQKIVEGYDGGEKPAVLLAGHYHKLNYQVIRNVHTVQTGCTQDQTPFARKKKISFNVGGGIAEIKLDPDTGAVTRFRLEIFNYFVRSFYNNRWNMAGDVVLADRS